MLHLYKIGFFDNNFFDSMVNRIYPSELQLNKVNVSDAEASFLDLHLSISDGFVKTKIYDKRDDFDFDRQYVELFEYYFQLLKVLGLWMDGWMFELFIDAQP